MAKMPDMNIMPPDDECRKAFDGVKEDVEMTEKIKTKMTMYEPIAYSTSTQSDGSKRITVVAQLAEKWFLIIDISHVGPRYSLRAVVDLDKFIKGKSKSKKKSKSKSKSKKSKSKKSKKKF